MKRFLGSLHVHVDESKNDLRDVHKKASELEEEYSRIRKNVNRSITYRSFKPRYIDLDSSNVSSRKSVSQVIKEKPKYIPASQFPLPMQPALFKIKLHAINADRFVKRAKNNDMRLVNTFNDNTLPEIDIDHISITGKTV